MDRDKNHYKIVAALFGAAYAAPNKSTMIFIHTNFLILISPFSRSSISEVDI